MGQPTHPLILHSGKSQLWSWGPSVLFKESLYAWQTKRTLLGLRYVLSIISGLLIIHSSHPWAPRGWLGCSLYRQKIHTKSTCNVHLPNLMRKRIKRRYFRYTPRRSWFSDGENIFYEFAMDRRWSFFKLYVWGFIHIFRLKNLILICVVGVPLKNLEKKNNKKNNKEKKIIKKDGLISWF